MFANGMILVMFIYAGVKKHGVKFFKNSLFPSGVPAPFYILVTPIELLSTFILRPVTLALRLLMNMIAGHLLLVLCFSATQFFFFQAEGLMSLFGAGTLLFGDVYCVHFISFRGGLVFVCQCQLDVDSGQKCKYVGLQN